MESPCTAPDSLEEPASAPNAALRYVWRDGQLLDAREAAVSPFDHGLLTGDGVFETLVSYGGRAFAAGRHYRRLVRSAAALGLAVPPEETFRAAMAEVLGANRLDRARVRVTLTGGEAPLGSQRGDGGPTLIVAAEEAPATAPAARVATVPWTRNEGGALAGVKTTSYGENVRAFAYAREREAAEAIFANTRGDLCEGSGSNIFLVLDGALLTPPLDSGCLEGCTRGIVLDLCASGGPPCEERSLPLSRLAEAQEAFLTSTLREVQPVSHVDGAPLRKCPGPVTEALQARFRELASREIDP